jgi:UDP-glucose 4-epimerase
MAPARCLVTGCAGFVGSHLCQALLAEGCEVVGLDNFFSGHRRNMDSFAGRPEFRFYEADIAAQDGLAGIVARHGPIRVCFHLAAVVSVAWSMDNPERTLEVNHLSSERLHRLCREAGVGSFVFAGSAAEYGQTGESAVAEDAAGPDTVQESPYGRSKYLVSRLVGESGYGVSLRCFNIYGPRQDPGSPYSGVISRFCQQALAGEPVTIFGDGGQTRDFIHVSDVVEAYLRAAGLSGTSGTALRGIYNVGRGESQCVRDLAATVKALAGSRAETLFFPERPGDIRHSLADVSKLARAVGFAPKVGMDEGLAQTLDWMGREIAASGLS